MCRNYNIRAFYSCSDFAAFMIDTFNRLESREKKKRKGIIIIFYDVPTTRVIREISISANCRLIVSAHPPLPIAAHTTPLFTNNLVHYKTHFDPSGCFVTVSRITTKTFSVTFRTSRVINIKTKILNGSPYRYTYINIIMYRIISKNNVVKSGVDMKQNRLCCVPTYLYIGCIVFVHNFQL